MAQALFTPVVPDSQLNPLYRAVATLEGYRPARVMMERAFKRFHDVDGNFVQQFQTTGFNARVWELYLHALFEEFDAAPVRLERPDFRLRRNSRDVYVEAVTANPSGLSSPDAQPPPTVEARMKDFIPVRLGGALYSKLNERYWDDPEVGRWPLVFAIESFTDSHSLLFSGAALANYLYGFTQRAILDAEGRLIDVKHTNITDHRLGTKIVPSGLFNQPLAEHVSGVLFSNSGTVPKFLRMGIQEGITFEKPVRVLRTGLRWDKDPSAAVPIPFSYEVGDPSYPEDWRQGLELFHNPRALNPIPRTFFYGVHQSRIDEDGAFVSEGPDFHPFASRTNIIVPRDDDHGAES